MEVQVKATEVQVGDIVGCSEVSYRVKNIRRVTTSVREGKEYVPQDIRDVGGWVSLAGDSDDGYFMRVYGGEEDYYAYPTEMITVTREDENR